MYVHTYVCTSMNVGLINMTALFCICTVLCQNKILSINIFIKLIYMYVYVFRKVFTAGPDGQEFDQAIILQTNSIGDVFDPIFEMVTR